MKIRRYAVDEKAGSCKCAGMTLIELIITLSILAAVASIAIVTLSDMGQTSRYEETSRRGQIAQRAVIGEPGEISRFVNDMGRYPMVLVDVPNESDNDIKEKLTHWYLAELYDIEVDDYVNSTEVYVYTAAEAAAVRSRMCFMDVSDGEDSFDYDFNADGSATPDAKFPGTSFQVGMKTGWDGPYLINQYEDYTDNYGQPWAVNVNTNASVKNVWNEDWTTFRRNSDGSVELEIVPALNDQITSIRSDFNVQADSGGLFTPGDFSTTEDEYSYANEVEDLTFPFYDSHIFADLTVNLYVQDYSGNWMTAGEACTPLPETNKYDRARVMLYVPFCERAVVPQLFEISAWYDGGSSTNLGVRYRSWNGSDYEIYYSYYAQDGNGNGEFTTSSPDTSGFNGSIPDVIRTLCEVTDMDADNGVPPWNGTSKVTFTVVPVGRRKIWAYAYSSADTGNDGERYSPVQTIEIKPGHNVVNLYLSETGF